ncbi:hypothetical protein VNI00_012923 [Paramarasmius palmivorus]|uniref:Endoplasmic reticulum junction formation protein lunapark n=1 Tax=Paramarasmius palmivorus TaxID=297713 RepID=A0AAW0C202_9AGAR
MGWFRKKNDDDYETILSTLARDIQKRQVQLSEIRLRERRATLLVTMYTLAAWVGYVALWYTSILPGRNTGGAVERAVRGIPVVLGPILILFIRRIVQIWYTRKGDAEGNPMHSESNTWFIAKLLEKTLQQLLKQQRAKVEEIKKKTNYYSTRDLLQRYDEQNTPSSTPTRPRVPPQQVQAVTPTPQRPAVMVPPTGPFQTPISQNLRAHLSPVSPSPPGPPRKQWFDKLADVVLGEEDSARFALICEKCFAHNGLVKESVWDDTQYVCPNCKHFNPSKKAKKQTDIRPYSSNTSPTGDKSPSSLGNSTPSPKPQTSSTTAPDDQGDQSMMDVAED